MLTSFLMYRRISDSYKRRKKDTKGDISMGLSDARATQEMLAAEQGIYNDQIEYYRQLVALRAEHQDSFINDRGNRHINNRNDKTGVTYGFWITSKNK